MSKFFLKSKHDFRYLKKLKNQKNNNEFISIFQNIIYTHFQRYGRNLPWRKSRDPYKILISEIMLQQTQVDRVIAKYEEFINSFPNFYSLHRAHLKNILKVWQGLGYNRRAIALKKIAELVINRFQGILPSSEEMLITLPGIGKYSAAAICAFAFNKPTIFIETNIRTVFLFFFFPDEKKIFDKEIIPLIEQTLDKSNPREWYYALMDYGSILKKNHKQLNKKSAHYALNTPFRGSDRQIRGRILKYLINKSNSSESEMMKHLKIDKIKMEKILSNLQKEGFICKKGVTYRIK